MTADRFRYLLAAYRQGACTATELEELESLLSRDWEGIRLGQDVPGIDWEKMYDRIIGDDKQTTVGALVRRMHPLWRYVAAAAVLVSLGTAAYFYFLKPPAEIAKTEKQPFKNDILPGGNKAVLTLSNGKQIILYNATNGTLAVQKNATIIKTDSGQLSYKATREKPGSGEKTFEIVFNTLSTPRGGQYHLQLSDGTDVWLNSASSIKYPVVFTGKTRDVEITGEAYFEVSKDPSRPFHVRSNQTEVEVLGTHFDINAYPDEDTLRTTLLEGHVRVRHEGHQQLLEPGQQALLSNGGRLSLSSSVDLDEVMAWKNGRFQFNHTPLAIVLRQLSRWYDVDIEYEGSVPRLKIWGKMQRDLNLSEVLDGLRDIGVHFRIESRKLIVQP